MINNPDASYEVCPRCQGTGQHQTPDNTMVICDYCKGNGVIAFIDENEPSEYVTESVGISETKIGLINQFVLFTLVTMVSNIIHSLWSGEILGFEWFNSLINSIIWGAGIGAALSAMMILFLNYIPILTGSAVFEDDNYVILNESNYKKQIRWIKRSNLIAIFIFAQITLIGSFPVVLFISLLETVIFDIDCYEKKGANLIIRIILGILSIFLLIFVFWSMFDGTINLNLPAIDLISFFS